MWNIFLSFVSRKERERKTERERGNAGPRSQERCFCTMNPTMQNRDLEQDLFNQLAWARGRTMLGTHFLICLPGLLSGSVSQCMRIMSEVPGRQRVLKKCRGHDVQSTGSHQCFKGRPMRGSRNRGPGLWLLLSLWHLFHSVQLNKNAGAGLRWHTAGPQNFPMDFRQNLWSG